MLKDGLDKCHADSDATNWQDNIVSQSGQKLDGILKTQHGVVSLQDAIAMGRLETTLQFSRKHFMRWCSSNGFTSLYESLGCFERRDFDRVVPMKISDFVSALIQSPWMSHFISNPTSPLLAMNEWDHTDACTERIESYFLSSLFGMPLTHNDFCAGSRLLHSSDVSSMDVAVALEQIRLHHHGLMKQLHPDLHVFKPSPSTLFYAAKKGKPRRIAHTTVFASAV